MSSTRITSRTRQRRPFRDTNYCSWLGNERLYSLSRVLRDLGLKPDFGDVDPLVILNAANRGKLTEGYCYDLLQGKPVTVRAKHCGSLHEGVAERAKAFLRWKEKYQPEYVDHQSFVWSEEDRVCWIRDFRAIINGQLTLVDIKCTSQPAKDWPLHLGCGLSYDEDGCNNAAILHLNPSLNKAGYRFIEKWPGHQLKSMWRRAVARWHSNYDFNRLINELGFDSEALGFETEEGLSA